MSTERDELATTARALKETAERLVVERAELQRAAVELGRWQAQHSTTQAQHAAHLNEINGSIASIDKTLSAIQTVQAVQRWALGLAAAVGSLLGGGLVTIVLNGGL